MAISALRVFYGVMLKRPVAHIEECLPRPRKVTRRARVYSREELRRLFVTGCRSLRDRAFLMTVETVGWINASISPSSSICCWPSCSWLRQTWLWPNLLSLNAKLSQRKEERAFLERIQAKQKMLQWPVLLKQRMWLA